MTHLLVIGGASTDVLHFSGQQTVSPGGAGMYTAMAAQRCGIQVSLFAPRPHPVPDALDPFADRLASWLGPVVPPEELAAFEIVHQDGGTTYLSASVGAEASLAPEDLPADLSSFDCIHIIPLGDAQRQLAFVQACRQRGARRISVGSSLDRVTDQPKVVREVLEQADIAFMNANEAARLFDSVEQAATRTGKLLYVTLGKKGALVLQGSSATSLPAVPSKELDPTGAGDTFCGSTLARLLHGDHPVMAARAAIPLSAQVTEQVGPTALFSEAPPPELPPDARAAIDGSRVELCAQQIASLPDIRPSPFTGPEFPPIGHPQALDLFFASTLQQFGFWTVLDGRYHQPLIAPIGGRDQKGSSYLAHAYLRPLEQDPGFYTPARQADLTREELLALFRAEDGSDPMPAVDLHLAQAQRYGRDMLALDLTPQGIIDQARASTKPLQTFLGILDQLNGYKEDPLRKKSNLLALILNQRPEGFLQFSPDERVAPVIDYHLMRSCLRIGLVEVFDSELRGKLVARQVLEPADEWAVRFAAYHAIEQVIAHSAKSPGAVDWFFFNARKRCPEMTDPICQHCPVDPVCAHRKEMFQPVLRTTFY